MCRDGKFAVASVFLRAAVSCLLTAGARAFASKTLFFWSIHEIA